MSAAESQVAPWRVSAVLEPVPFEVYEAGVYLHGTKADLAVGDLLVSGRESNFEAGRVMNLSLIHI